MIISPILCVFQRYLIFILFNSQDGKTVCTTNLVLTKALNFEDVDKFTLVLLAVDQVS